MNKWDECRLSVDSFDLQYEITRVDLSKPRDVKAVLKDIKKFAMGAGLATLGVYNINRAIFTPRENARQKGSVEGMGVALSECIKLLKDSIHYEWEPETILQELTKSIEKNYEYLRLAQANLDEKKPKKIYEEMFFVSKIDSLIYVWGKLFYTDERLMEIYRDRNHTN